MFPDISNLSLKGPIESPHVQQYRIMAPKSVKNRLVTFTSPMVNVSNLSTNNNYICFSSSLKSPLVTFLKSLEERIEGILSTNVNVKSATHPWMGVEYGFARADWSRVKCYNLDGEDMSVDSLTKGTTIRMHLWIKGVYVNDSKWNIQIEVLQVRICEPSYPQGCMIELESDEEESPPPKGEDPAYAPYRKMLSMGIPMAAVRQKCAMQGMNSSFLEGKPTESPKRGPLLSTGLLQGIQLRKTVPQKKKPVVSTTKGLVPSLEDILQIRGKLRRVT